MKKFVGVFATIAMSVSPLVVGTQGVADTFIGDLAKEGAKKAQEYTKQAPGLLGILATSEPRVFDTEKACLSELQLSVNAGVAIGGIMPFSRVWIFEDDQGPAARLRLLIDGEKVHSELHCEDSEMIVRKLDWNADLPDMEPYDNGTLNAGLGVWLVMSGRTDQLEEEQKDVLDLELQKQLEDLRKKDAEEDAAAESIDKEAPLTDGEKALLAVMVENCWNTGSLGEGALGTKVVLEISMNPDARPDDNSIQLVESSGGSQEAAQQAYEAARRAVIRCGARGFALPPEKYEHWKTIRLTFDASTMRIE